MDFRFNKLIKTINEAISDKKYPLFCPKCDDMTTDYSGTGKDVKCNKCNTYINKKLRKMDSDTQE